MKRFISIFSLLITAIFLLSCKGINITINFDTDGGTEVEPIINDGSSTITIPKNLEKEGFIFDGWYWDKETYTRPFTANSLLDEPITSDLTVYAKWLPESIFTTYFEVKFDSLGGSSIDSQSIQFRRFASEPVDPIRIGYMFGGWYKDRNYTQLWNYQTDKVEHNFTLYAKWNLITNDYYIVNFVPNFDYEIPNQQVYKGSTLTVPIISRIGYTLEGWYTSINNGLTLDEKWSFVNNTVNSNLTLYAKWTKNQSTISFNSNGGSAVYSITKDYDSIINQPENPTRIGYLFEGWYLDEAFTTSFTFTTMPLESITLYAKWKVPYTISFNSNGGSSVDSINQEYNTIVTKPIDPTRAGYTFGGWYIDQAFITSYTFTTMPLESITLYAKWNVNTYTISFDSNGGSSVDSITQDYNTTISKPTNPTKNDLIFGGWYLDLTFRKSFTFTEFTTMPSENLTLYAKWRTLNAPVLEMNMITTNNDAVVEFYPINNPVFYSIDIIRIVNVDTLEELNVLDSVIQLSEEGIYRLQGLSNETNYKIEYKVSYIDQFNNNITDFYEELFKTKENNKNYNFSVKEVILSGSNVVSNNRIHLTQDDYYSPKWDRTLKIIFNEKISDYAIEYLFIRWNPINKSEFIAIDDYSITIPLKFASYSPNGFSVEKLDDLKLGIFNGKDIDEVEINYVYYLMFTSELFDPSKTYTLDDLNYVSIRDLESIFHLQNDLKFEIYEIDTVEDFMNMPSNGIVQLKNDLDFENVEFSTLFPSFDNSFKGYFGGNGYTLSNIHITHIFEHYTESYLYGSLFGINDGVIENLNVDNMNIDIKFNYLNNGDNRNYTMGGLTNRNEGTIRDISISGEARYDKFNYLDIGMVSGDNFGKVFNVTSDFNVYISNSNFVLGGMINALHRGDNVDLYASGNINIDTVKWINMGGIAGHADEYGKTHKNLFSNVNFNISNSCNSNYICNLGGIFGTSYVQYLSNVFYGGTMTMTGNYNINCGYLVGNQQSAYDQVNMIDPIYENTLLIGNKIFGINYTNPVMKNTIIINDSSVTTDGLSASSTIFVLSSNHEIFTLEVLKTIFKWTDMQVDFVKTTLVD